MSDTTFVRRRDDRTELVLKEKRKNGLIRSDCGRPRASQAKRVPVHGHRTPRVRELFEEHGPKICNRCGETKDQRDDFYIGGDE